MEDFAFEAVVGQDRIAGRGRDAGRRIGLFPPAPEISGNPVEKFRRGGVRQEVRERAVEQGNVVVAGRLRDSHGQHEHAEPVADEVREGTAVAGLGAREGDDRGVADAVFAKLVEMTEEFGEDDE